jgi:hypothetical protein
MSVIGGGTCPTARLPAFGGFASGAGSVVATIVSGCASLVSIGVSFVVASACAASGVLRLLAHLRSSSRAAPSRRGAIRA